MPCFSCGKPQPTITSTMSFGSRPSACSTASRIANASRSSGRTSMSEPFPARPIGVRTALTMTASGTSGSPQVKADSTGQRTADDQGLDLARALVQGRDARVAKVFRHRVFVDVAVAAEHLDGGVRGAHGRLARVPLRDRRLGRVRRAGVGERRRPPGQEPRRLGLDVHLGEQLLHELEGGDRLAERLALLRVADRRVEAALRDPDAARRRARCGRCRARTSRP